MDTPPPDFIALCPHSAVTRLCSTTLGLIIIFLPPFHLSHLILICAIRRVTIPNLAHYGFAIDLSRFIFC